jgi:hypothetical protein
MEALTPKRLEKIRTDVLVLGNFSGWKRNYNIAPNVTDQPSTVLFVSLGGHKAVTEVYGLMIQGTRLPAFTVMGGGRSADELPENLKTLYAYLAGLRFEGSSPWMPQFVEVMLWPYEYAPQKSIRWPSDWPNFDSPTSLQRGDEYSIFLPCDKLGELRAFLKTRDPKGAVQVAGKKWAIAYRFVFPGESAWASAIRGQ